MNKISLSSEIRIRFTVVFTNYNSDPARTGKISSDVVVVGMHSYTKEEMSMVILNTLISLK